MNIRIGQGYDVHAFGEGDHVMLGGVRVPHERGLAAHSDGDVVLHALCDAMLALALGIGTHFRPRTRAGRTPTAGCSAPLQRAAARARRRVGNADVTVVCERPKVGPHAQAMRETIATDLGVGLDAISVKATTNERMGFIGRREGIAALAACLLVAA